MQLDDKVRQNPETPMRHIDDFAHVLDTTSGTLHTFNEVGGRIWELIENEQTVQSIVADIVTEYDVDPRTAQADVLAFLNDLREKGLVLTQ